MKGILQTLCFVDSTVQLGTHRMKGVLQPMCFVDSTVQLGHPQNEGFTNVVFCG